MSGLAHIFDLSRLEERWRAQPAAPAASAQRPFAPQQALVVLCQLEEAIGADLGPRRKSVQPALSEVRALLTALYPEDGPSALIIPQQAEHTKLLRAALDRLEDLLEALCLSRRQDRSPWTMPRRTGDR